MEKVLMNTNDWKLIDKARAGKNEGRDRLKNINITSNHVEATNGRVAVRLDRAAISIKKDSGKRGPYEIITAKKYSATFTELTLERAEDVQYPDINQIWPDIYGKATQEITISPDKVSTTSLTSAVLGLFKLTGNGYAAGYLGLISHYDRVWRAYNIGENKPVVMVSEDVQIVIMPFKINE